MSVFLLLTGNVEKSSDFGIRAIREIRDENQN
ncbi:MAG: hypothetical protein C5S45_03045 [Candidatus Methanocomedens sp.]|jgi:hypothetical protein|nr:MAG: hypothetical protein C5S45_03045 [ANME-2 cluster archaeon]